MSTMDSPTVITLDRSRRVHRAMAARRRLHEARPADRRGRERSSGRMWLNGGELGGARDAFAHLSESYD